MSIGERELQELIMKYINDCVRQHTLVDLVKSLTTTYGLLAEQVHITEKREKNG